MFSVPLVSLVNLKSFIPACNAKMFAKVLGYDAVPRRLQPAMSPIHCLWPHWILDALEKGQPFPDTLCGSVARQWEECYTCSMPLTAETNLLPNQTPFLNIRVYNPSQNPVWKQPIWCYNAGWRGHIHTCSAVLNPSKLWISVVSCSKELMQVNWTPFSWSEFRVSFAFLTVLMFCDQSG